MCPALAFPWGPIYQAHQPLASPSKVALTSPHLVGTLAGTGTPPNQIPLQGDSHISLGQPQHYSKAAPTLGGSPAHQHDYRSHSQATEPVYQGTAPLTSVSATIRAQPQQESAHSPQREYSWRLWWPGGLHYWAPQNTFYIGCSFKTGRCNWYT